MKYLIKRDEFIRSTKVSETKSDFMMDLAKTKKLYEAGGPFHNDITWNDSLLGRLVDHVIRKAKIMVNLVRIKPLTWRLKSEFDRLAVEGIITNLESTEDKLEIQKVIVSGFYEALVNEVDNNGNVGEIKGLTKEAIEFTNDLIKKPEYKELELDKPKSELEEFEKFLEQFKDDEGGERSEEEEEKEEESDNQNYKKEHIDNLFALKGILEGLKSLELGIAAAQNSNSDKKTKNIKPGDTLQKISQETGVDITTIKSKNTWLSKYNDTDALPTKDKTTNKEYTLVLETLIIESSVSSFLGTLSAKIVKLFKSKGGDQKNIKQNILNALIKYRDSIRSLSDNNKIPITLELINELITNKEKYAEKISVLYREVNYWMVGKKKSSFNYTPDKLMENEDLSKKKIGSNLKKDTPEIITSNGKEYYLSDMAWKISKFALRAYQVDAADLYDVLDAVSAPTKNFVNTLRSINGEVSTNENKLYRYDNFINSLNELLDPETEKEINASDEERDTNKPLENDDDDDKKLSPVATGSVSEKIKDFFDRNCKTVRSYVMDKAEVEKVCSNFDKIAEQNKETFVIPGMDPIIQIVRLFNRAYKLYMTKTISKRTGGKVASSVYNDYTTFGGNNTSGENLNGWAGPFRNNRIFNVWEDKVLEIMGDKKYEFIFSNSTSLRLPKVPNPQSPEDYELRKGAGAKLRDFINDMLDGDDLYKSGSDKGAQKKFIEKYFGTLSDNEIKKDLSIPGSNDSEINSDVSESIENGKQIVKFTRNVNPEEKWTKGMLFILSVELTKEDGKTTTGQRYIMIEGPNSISYSKTMFFYDKLITKSENKDKLDGRKWVIEKGDLDKLEMRSSGTDNAFDIRYSKTKQLLDIIFKKNNKVEITYNTTKDKDVEKSEIFTIKDILWLCSEEGDKKNVFTANISDENYKKTQQMYGNGSPMTAAQNVKQIIDSNTRLNIKTI